MPARGLSLRWITRVASRATGDRGAIRVHSGMPVPTHEDCMLPALLRLADDHAHHRTALADEMADHFKLTSDERNALLPSGKATVIRSRTGWALSYMKQANLVQSVRRGWYQITDAGQQLLKSSPARIDNSFLMRFDSFQEFRARSRATPADKNEPTQVKHASESASEVSPPDEQLESAYAQIRASIETDVLDTVRAVTPSFFEDLVIDLLVRMGYGGNREEAARRVGRSGDGGIDGVIDEDRLGLDVIYVQAKRWEATVGRPEIQKFAGALQGQRAKKGIFITTSTFSRDAEEYAQRIDSRIVLIDGRRLAELMFQYDVGVSARSTYTVKAIDGDYFEESLPTAS